VASGSETLFEDPQVTDRYLDHYETLRGKVREEIVRRHLREVALVDARRKLRVVDVGCGDGRDARWLSSLGHDVLAVDPSSEMIARACSPECASGEGRSPTFEVGNAESVLGQFGQASFDLVLSHGVIMYQDDPAAFLAEHLSLLRPGGLLSLLAKNAEALVYRAAHEASVDEAMQVLDDSQSIGHLGVSTGAQTMQALSDFGLAAGATVRSWAGVRMFSDTPTDALIKSEDEQVIELEWRAALRDPYRRTASLLHVIMLNGVDLSLLPS
jgi:SAM-dependent methyltransferase